MGKRTERGNTLKSKQAAYSKSLLYFGLLRGFAAKVGRDDIEQKYNQAIAQLLGQKI